MKIFLVIITLITSLILLNSCAKPTVVSIVDPKDEKLNCDQLETAILEAQKIKKEAEYAQGATGGNVTRMMLFWPAWARTLHNADVAIAAANDRSYHLANLMKKKKCEGIDTIYAEIKSSTIYKNSIADQLKDLDEMYKSGVLTKEEFEMAKKKTLSQ